ncbi:Gfo/Idh/MocA family oxidoreductase [Microbacteriaceae bacterium K1510]|nr:Gfo/Idh/MocA family oxidoreductase [Microbacteriaceae bacterium K1510]
MERRLRLGVAGLGRAFTLMLPTLAEHPRLQLVAAADPREEARSRFAKEFQAPSYATVEALCADPHVETVYLATPHQFHVQHTLIAASHAKHVLVEKPMALTLADCQTMANAVRRAGVHMLVGHSHSFDGPYLRTRKLIAEGRYGRLRMIHAANYTDFLYRPRRPEELVTAEGGGAVFSQAPHQVDIVRLLGGGKVKTVRALTGAWDPSRPTEGAYTALLTFDDGVFASLTYSGYGHFDTDEFCGWVGELGQLRDPDSYGTARAALRRISSPEDEASQKNKRTYGAVGRSNFGSEPGKPLHNHFGHVVASCEQADLRPVPQGVMIYGDHTRRLDDVAMPVVPRGEVIDELYDAVVNGLTPIHSAEWGLATMEVVLAILESARSGQELTLRHQVAAPA